MNPYSSAGVSTVINAAGKMTALGGTAQNAAVAQAQADAARAHVDLAELRAAAGVRIARSTGAQAASVTPGAAAGIAIGIAAILTGNDIDKVRRVPDVDGPSEVLIQHGHDINFGADVTQMIRMGGGNPVVFGSAERVTESDLDLATSAQTAAIVYVKSHHCTQENRLPLETLVGRGVPVLVDAAADGDLRTYIGAGADLVTYSGGKAIGGPTSGFITGNAALIEACELQQRGIARAMKVGKEQIMGLLTALDSEGAEASDVLGKLQDGLAAFADVSIVDDRAGRPIQRIALRLPDAELKALVQFLRDGEPSIRTRNHQLAEGYVLFDPREVSVGQVPAIIDRVREFFDS